MPINDIIDFRKKSQREKVYATLKNLWDNHEGAIKIVNPSHILPSALSFWAISCLRAFLSIFCPATVGSLPTISNLSGSL